VIFFHTHSFAQEPQRLFIAPMERDFETYMMAAILKNKLPVVIVTDEKQADYVVSGNAVKGPHKWYDTIFGASRDREQASIKLLRRTDQTIAWAGSAGDKSLWLGSYKGGGMAKVANRLARQMRDNYFKRRRPGN
jgi:hypothetical protein